MTRFSRNLVVLLSVLFTALVLVGISRARGRRAASVEITAAPTAGPAVPDARPPLPAPAPSEAVVKGRLVDERTGKPIAGALVQFRAQSATRGLAAPVTSVASSDGTGAFAVPRLPGGYLRLRVEKEGYLTDVVEARVPRGEPSLDVGTVRLMKGDWQRKIEGGPRGLVGLDHELRDGRVVITGVRPHTSADRAGLRPGETIVSVDGQRVDRLLHAARTYLLQGKAGTSATVVVEARDGTRRTAVLERQQVPGVTDIPTFY
jgi:hypothetical protein